MMRWLHTALLLAFFSFSCSSSVWKKLTPAGEKVRVTGDATASTACSLIGPVQSTGFYGPDEAIVILQNKTAEMGGDLVVIVVQPSRGVGARGEAFRCAPKAP